MSTYTDGYIEGKALGHALHSETGWAAIKERKPGETADYQHGREDGYRDGWDAHTQELAWMQEGRRDLVAQSWDTHRGPRYSPPGGVPEPKPKATIELSMILPVRVTEQAGRYVVDFCGNGPIFEAESQDKAALLIAQEVFHFGWLDARVEGDMPPERWKDFYPKFDEESAG